MNHVYFYGNLIEISKMLGTNRFKFYEICIHHILTTSTWTMGLTTWSTCSCVLPTYESQLHYSLCKTFFEKFKTEIFLYSNRRHFDKSSVTDFFLIFTPQRKWNFIQISHLFFEKSTMKLPHEQCSDPGA